MNRCAAVVLVLLSTSAIAGPKDSVPSMFARPVVAVGGGVAGFVGPALRDVTQDGGAWSARVSAGGTKGVRFEIAYTGSAQRLDEMQGGLLVGTGVVGMLRVNVAPWVSDTIEPFVFVGGGWTRFHVRDRRPTSSLAETDDILDMPMGIGAARRFGRYVLDVRGGLNISSGADLLPVQPDPSSSQDRAVMHRFGLSASLGFEL